MDHAVNVPQLKAVTKWICAGHSMGGRVACIVANECPECVLACILYSYPLHPPGKLEELRDDPLCKLRTPLLFIRGTKDTFCVEGPWGLVVPRLQTKRLLVHSVVAGTHSLKVPGGAQKQVEAIEAMTTASLAFIREVTQGTRDHKDVHEHEDAHGHKKAFEQDCFVAAAAASGKSESRRMNEAQCPVPKALKKRRITQ